MKLKAVLFDLDGTLLPMDLNEFIGCYMHALGARMQAHGYDPRALTRAIFKGTDAMLKNDGSKTNEAVFWDTFASIYGEAARGDEKHFARFYEEDFDSVKQVTAPTEKSAEVIRAVKGLGLRTVLATNPVFPRVATERRISWAGLSREDFELCTSYENSSYCKPNPLYYEEILQKIGLCGEECLMVGNDAVEDMAAEKAGMKVFLLTECLITHDRQDLDAYPQGGYEELLEYIRSLV